MRSPEELLARQGDLQREAVELTRELGLEEVLGKAGRVVAVGSSVTGLMVWRDLDFVVDAPGLSIGAAFQAMLPLLARCRAARYENDLGGRRHYFVLRIPWRGERVWKLDVSFFVDGAPTAVERFQQEVLTRLTDEARLAILELKEARHRDPAYPEVYGGYEICDAVLNHGVRTLTELDAYLRECQPGTTTQSRASSP